MRRNGGVGQPGRQRDTLRGKRITKSKNILFLASALSAGLSGCSEPDKTAAQPLSAKASLESTNSFYGHGFGEGGGVEDISSHIFGIEGRVVRIHKTSRILKSITVELIKSLPTALGWVPYEKPGEIIVIHFDESLFKLGSLRLTNGCVVRLDFGQIDVDPKKAPGKRGGDWGSNFSWLTVENNGAFYNIEGVVHELEW